MNWFFKLLAKFLILVMFTFATAFGRDIIVITASIKDREQTDLIEKILKEKNNIPAALISKKIMKEPCEKIKTAIVQICYQNSEIIFPVFNKQIVQESFKIFSQETRL